MIPFIWCILSLMLSQCQFKGISAPSTSVSLSEWNLPFCGLFLKRLATRWKRKCPQMTLIAKSLYIMFSLTAYLGSDVHEFQWFRVFKGQELEKVSDMTIFYLHYLRVVWNTVEEYYGKARHTVLRNKNSEGEVGRRGWVSDLWLIFQKSHGPTVSTENHVERGSGRGGTAVNP